MADIMELSSDSNDTVILPIFTENDKEFEMAGILNKYIANTPPGDSKEGSSGCYLSHEENELLKEPDEKKLKLPFQENVSPQPELSSEVATLRQLFNKYQQIQCLDKDTSNSILNQQEKTIEELRSTHKLLTEKQQKKLDKDAERQEKVKERQLKKEQAARERAMKQALATSNKNIKREECMKFITVLLDTDIIVEEYGKDLVKSLQDAEVAYRLQSQIFPDTITWTRKVETHSVTDDGKLTASSRDVETDEVLLMMTCLDFIKHVNNGTLCAHIESLKSVLNNKHITLGIFGLQKYLRYRKNRKNSEHRSQVTNDASLQTRDSKLFKDVPDVTRRAIETSLTEIQLITSCSYRLTETSVDFGSLVLQFTKAIAQLPYKLKQQKQQTDWFASGDNKDCVKVDKNGNGLQRLWRQVLTTFPWARLETAEAISAQYQTPSALMEAYEKCRSQKDGEQLLQDIPVRRAAGPLTSVRKVGPEFSRKLHNHFTAVDGDFIM